MYKYQVTLQHINYRNKEVYMIGAASMLQAIKQTQEILNSCTGYEIISIIRKGEVKEKC